MSTRRKSLIDFRHPFFRPLWRRVVVTLVLLGWTGFEISLGNLVWAALFGALGAYAAYVFFFAFDTDSEDTSGE